MCRHPELLLYNECSVLSLCPNDTLDRHLSKRCHRMLKMGRDTLWLGDKIFSQVRFWRPIAGAPTDLSHLVEPAVSSKLPAPPRCRLFLMSISSPNITCNHGKSPGVLQSDVGLTHVHTGCMRNLAFRPVH